MNMTRTRVPPGHRLRLCAVDPDAQIIAVDVESECYREYIRTASLRRPAQGRAGTELKKIFSLITIEAVPGCNCDELANLMDEEGDAWCLKNFEWLLRQLKEGSRLYSLAAKAQAAVKLRRSADFNIDWSDPLRSMLAEAIRRSQAATAATCRTGINAPSNVV